MYLMDAISQVGERGRHVPSNALMSGYIKLAEAIKPVPRFLLDNRAIATAVELTLGRPKILWEALANARIPYEGMWVEWAEEGRERLRSGIFTEPLETETRPLPKRLGFYLEADKTGRAGIAIWAWLAPESIASGIPNIAPISPHFNLDHQFEQSDNRIQGFLRGNLARMWEGNDVQLKALFDIWRTAEHLPSQWGYDYLQFLAQQPGVDLTEQIANMMADVYGEYIIIWAIILMLTASRPLVNYRKVDLSRLNKQRVKRRDMPLLDHTAVTMQIGERQVAGQLRQPLAYQRKSPRVHMVSSYLARRGTRHWIVSPYVRGSGEAIYRRVNVHG